jgi:hypothetical protein
MPKIFKQANYPMPLRLPDGTPYVDGAKYDDILESLRAGMAVFVQSCNGRAFIWRDGDRYLVDHFFFAPARHLQFASAEEAADFGADLCE